MCFGYLSLAPNKYLCTCQSSPVNQPVASVQNNPCSRDREVQREQEALFGCCITSQPEQGCSHSLYILPKSGGSHASPDEGRQPGPAWPPSAMVRSTQKLQIIEKGATAVMSLVIKRRSITQAHQYRSSSHKESFQINTWKSGNSQVRVPGTALTLFTCHRHLHRSSVRCTYCQETFGSAMQHFKWCIKIATYPETPMMLLKKWVGKAKDECHGCLGVLGEDR